jgi:hypothetical protein
MLVQVCTFTTRTIRSLPERGQLHAGILIPDNCVFWYRDEAQCHRNLLQLDSSEIQYALHDIRKNSTDEQLGLRLPVVTRISRYPGIRGDYIGDGGGETGLRLTIL